MSGDCEALLRLLAPLTNYERTRPDGPRWSLGPMRARLARGSCRAPRPAVQIGGSKGKGTTVAYLESLARAAGVVPGAYTSPHVESLLERIRVGGEVAGAQEVHEVLVPVLADARAHGEDLTFFEAMTCAAANLFAARQVGVALFEVGLGGRLDATTALPVDASIVTNIELEHVELLGDTVELIAAEKAPVIRPQTPAFTAARGPALEVLLQHARTVAAPLCVLGQDLRLELTRDEPARHTGWLHLPGGRHRFTLAGAARTELPALALAAAAFAQLFPDRPLVLDPVPRWVPPGRFELRETPRGPLVLDGAHTEESLHALARELRLRFPEQRWRMLLASAAGKRWRAGFRHLLPLADQVHVTAITGTSSEDPATIADWIRAQGVAADVSEDPTAAVHALLATSGPRLVTGSFYLVGIVRRTIGTSMEPEQG